MVELIVKRIYFVFPIIIFLVLLSCKYETKTTDQISTLDELYKEWVESTNAKDIIKWSDFVSPEAVFLPPDSPPLESLTEIKDYYVKLFHDPNFKLECDQLFVEVAKSEDIAWSRGVCESTFSNNEGEIESGSSKWTKVWKRMSDGKWKCTLNTWNYN